MNDPQTEHVIGLIADGEAFVVKFFHSSEGRQAARDAVYRYAMDKSLPKFTAVEAFAMLTQITISKSVKGASP